MDNLFGFVGPYGRIIHSGFVMRTQAAGFILGSLLLAGCASPATMAQYRDAEKQTRVEIRVPEPKGTVFTRAMSALIEEGYTVKTAEKDAGVLVTAPKYTSGSSMASVMIGGSGKQALVLTINAVETGADSTLAVVSGTWQWEGATNSFAKAEKPITGAHAEWATLQRIGAKIRGAGSP